MTIEYPSLLNNPLLTKAGEKSCRYSTLSYIFQVQQYKIRPLSLHMRVHAAPKRRSLNTLTLKGSFTLAEMHSWIANCVPEVKFIAFAFCIDGFFFKNRIAALPKLFFLILQNHIKNLQKLNQILS